MQTLLAQNIKLKKTITELEYEIKQRCQNYLIQLQARTKKVLSMSNKNQSRSKNKLTVCSQQVEETIFVTYRKDNIYNLVNIQSESKTTQHTNRQSFNDDNQNISNAVNQSLLISSVSVLADQSSFVWKQTQQTMRSFQQKIRKYQQKLYIYQHVFLNISSIIQDSLTSSKSINIETLNQKQLNNLFNSIRKLKQDYQKMLSQNCKKKQIMQAQIIKERQQINNNKFNINFNKTQLQKFSRQLSFDNQDQIDEYTKLMEEDEQYQNMVKQLKFENIKQSVKCQFPEQIRKQNIEVKQLFQDQRYGQQQQRNFFELPVPQRQENEELSVISQKTSENRQSDTFNDTNSILEPPKSVQKICSTISQAQ